MASKNWFGRMPVLVCCITALLAAAPAMAWTDADFDGVLEGMWGETCHGGDSSACDDNCPADPNGGQQDADDAIGDVCDNCPAVSNVDQTDTDGDGIGNACDTDDDGDGVLDVNDNCPLVANANQLNTDSDGQGDACDTDDDNDTVLDVDDNCQLVANADQADADVDDAGDVCDTCPNDADDDADADGVCGDVDNCPADANANQLDTHSDGDGDVCDTDDDGDTVLDVDDNCPLVAKAELSGPPPGKPYNPVVFDLFPRTQRDRWLSF